MIPPREYLTAGSQERRAWVSTQARRTLQCSKMKQIQQLFAIWTCSKVHPKWVRPEKCDPPYLITIGVKDQILNVLAYIPICSEKLGSHHYMPMRVLQPLPWLQESKLQGFTHGMDTSHALCCNISQASQLPTCSEITIFLSGVLPKPLNGSWYSDHRYSTIALKERSWFWCCPWFKWGTVACGYVLSRAIYEAVCSSSVRYSCTAAGSFFWSLHSNR